MHLKVCPSSGKPNLLRQAREIVRQRRPVHLFDAAAPIAKKEHCLRGRTSLATATGRMGARDVGVGAFQLVHQSPLAQPFQRAVDLRRCAQALFAQGV